MSSTYEAGTRCWVPDEKEGWLGVEIVKSTNLNDKYQLELISEDGRTFKLETNSLDENESNDLPLLRNPIESVEDLTELSYLNEPSVLNAIKDRYSQFNIYTYSGIVLIATNPFQRNDELYSPHRIQRYASKRRGEEEPHLFAIAEEAYRCMKTDGENQSIVVSGESGAGKTVSAKYIMRYFASVDSDANNHDMSDTEKQILATNPIMESFGNAKTTRNDNSSRFGKYLEILFDKNIIIIGARIRTYLLERSRLVFQPKTERNYHIFYQMISGLSDDLKLKLDISKIEDYHYLNQGGNHIIDGIDDKKEFIDTCEALELVGISKDKQFELFKILSALLHIGNIEIVKTRNDAILSSDEPNLIKACNLLGLDPVQFSKWIVKKQITTRSEKIISNLNYQQACVARDSVAKYIYSSLFDWLVEYINADLCSNDLQSKIHSFIGVLDIYGFEHFDTNSFEQFCINYANEKLQQEFTQHVFKLEQDEYVREEIEWSFIQFSDNQPCINVIENKLGILSLLDEESRLPSGSDETWIDKMYQTLNKSPHDKVFKKPRFGNNKFIVSHYALDVEYDSAGFIDKNRDTVSDGHLETLKNSTNEMLLDVLATIERAAEKLANEQAAAAAATSTRNGPTKKITRKPTLGSIFKSSLIELMKTINSTNAHYIRCIKPNEEKKAWEFDPLMVLSQLRACGVLETIKISCAGFPSKAIYSDFVKNFSILVDSIERESLLHNNKKNEIDFKNFAEKVLVKTVNDPHKFQLGKTKIFFKAGILAYMEKLKTNKLNQSATIIQKNLRCYYGKKDYQNIKKSLLNIQSLIRGYLIRDQIRKEIEKNSAISIQSLIRGFNTRKEINNKINSIINLQALIRGYEFRLNSERKHKSNAAIKIQTALRGYDARLKYKKTIKSIVFTQSCLRKQLAKIEYKQLRTEAKSLNKMKEVQYSLENKVIELTQSLTSKVEENSNLVSQIENLQKLINDSKENYSNKELEFNDKFDNTINEHNLTVSNLNEEINKHKINYDEARLKVDELTELHLNLKKELQENIDELKKVKLELDNSNNENQSLNDTISLMKTEISDLQKQLNFAKLNNGIVNTSVNAGSAGSAGNIFGNSKSINRLSGSSSNDYEARPSSIISTSTSRDEGNLEAINTELWQLLKDSKTLHKEIVEGLLRGLRIPTATVSSELTRKEVLFPARIIIIILSDMWRLGLTNESEVFLGEVLSVIQNTVSSLKDDDVITHGAFWLTNTHELYSFVVYAQETIVASDSISQDMSPSEYDEYLKLVAVVKEDFESLSYNIYNMWMKKMQKDLEKKCISAVVLAQALPGFVAPESSPFLSKVFQSQPQYKMDDILTFFNTVYWSMKTYFIEPLVINEVVIELLKFVDALCFNDLIMRRNFLSWKRGLQLNYNVTRLEEWCKGHEIEEGSIYLAHLLQVSKLLQLRKNTPDDIEIIYEICHALKPAQIQKLISQYHVADYETPIAPAVTKALADKVKQAGGSTDFFEAINAEGHFDDPFRHVELRPFHRVEAYVPAWLNVPIIRRIIELVTKNATVQEALHQQQLQQMQSQNSINNNNNNPNNQQDVENPIENEISVNV
ncbi:hypothetical protein B5S28_g2523 [[Candida] boidinii]|nr:hypothetical protein B5S28_g2523 [[Candida] boidinii]OWB64407.1 hypothetical protein B5S29_g5504 [[Candida] boidinii]OWB75720.1 hypothetical protein B5S31_g5673 [[Candida] boidinii]